MSQSQTQEESTSQRRPRTAAKAGFAVLKVLVALAFISVWLSISTAWAVMTLPANLMSNDSGNASLWDYATLMAGMATGQLVFAAAGIPGGLAICWTGLRILWVWSFVILAFAGVAIQVWAFKTLAAAMGW